MSNPTPAPSPARWPRPLTLILIVYLGLGAQYALLTPAWQVPDEPAHYNVIRQIAATGALPRLEPGDYDQAYMERLTGERFPASLPVERIQYQDYQPPLYYLLATPVFLATGGSLAAVRLFSVALGGAALVFAYLALRALAGPHSRLPVIAAGFMAFIPQHVAMLAGVNNDSLSEVWVALGLYLMLRELGASSPGPARTSRFGPYALGLVIGLAFLTKVWGYGLAPAAAVMVLLQWRRAGWRFWRPALLRAAQIFGPALALGALYWGRNWVVCGPADFLCGQWHNQVVLGQPRTAEWVARIGWAGYLDSFGRTTFQSFWGQFGWMGVVMDQRVYTALALFSLALVIGLGLAAGQVRGQLAARWDGLLVLAAVAAVTLALYFYYNAMFVQFQGRYLFSALVPLSLAAAASLDAYARLIEGRLRRRLGWLIPAGALAAMAGLCVFALYRFILPALT